MHYVPSLFGGWVRRSPFYRTWMVELYLIFRGYWKPPRCFEIWSYSQRVLSTKHLQRWNMNMHLKSKLKVAKSCVLPNLVTSKILLSIWNPWVFSPSATCNEDFLPQPNVQVMVFNQRLTVNRPGRAGTTGTKVKLDKPGEMCVCVCFCWLCFRSL